MEIPAAPDDQGIVIHVRLTPKSNEARIGGIEMRGEKPALKAHVTAPPEDGKANAALIALVAGWLGVAKSKVSVASGQKSRMKTVRVAGAAPELMEKLRLLVADAAKAKKV